tara:strand:- start:127978 stop:128919 length:942 start_codon:yes stop_codon:yes gene_type:complete
MSRVATHRVPTTAISSSELLQRWRLSANEAAFQLLQATVLVLVGWYTIDASLDVMDAKAERLSVLGYLFPEAAFTQHALFVSLQCVTAIAFALWMLPTITQRGRVIFLLAPFAFLLMNSVAVETHYFTRHQTHFCAVAFLLLGIVRFTNDRPGQPTRTLPQWAYFLLLYYICVTYSYSGVAKIENSGIGWGNGSSLMFWVDRWAEDRDSLLFRMITGNVWIAMLMQNTAFLAELFCAAALFIPRLRPVFGAVLIGFHCSIELLFGLGFYANIMLDAIILVGFWMLPDYQVTPRDFIRDLLARGQPRDTTSTSM